MSPAFLAPTDEPIGNALPELLAADLIFAADYGHDANDGSEYVLYAVKDAHHQGFSVRDLLELVP